MDPWMNKGSATTVVCINTKGAKVAPRSQDHAFDALLEQNDVVRKESSVRQLNSPARAPDARRWRRRQCRVRPAPCSGLVPFVHPWSSLCFHSREPLPFKGDEFPRTDIAAARRSSLLSPCSTERAARLMARAKSRSTPPPCPTASARNPRRARSPRPGRRNCAPPHRQGWRPRAPGRSRRDS